MKVLVHVKEKCIPVSVGNGDQPVRWLANVGIARHDDNQGRMLGLPVGVKAEDGSMLNMDSTLAAAQISDMQHVWVHFKGASLTLTLTSAGRTWSLSLLRPLPATCRPQGRCRRAEVKARAKRGRAEATWACPLSWEAFTLSWQLCFALCTPRLRAANLGRSKVETRCSQRE